jgi:hypothetical protein
MLVLILACVGVGALLLGWVLRRVGVGWGRVISFSGGSLVRATAGFVLAWTAVAAADRDGVWFWFLAVVLGLVALATLALEGFRAWGALKFGVGDE